MGKEEAKKQYRHFVQPAKEVPDWWKMFNFHLVETMQDLEESFKDWIPSESFIAFDTETTGLNLEEDEIVGYSYCIDGKNAYYVPVYHFNYDGNLGEPAVEYIYNRMCEAKKVFMFNAKFDMRVIEYYGYKNLSEDEKKERRNFVKYDMSKASVFDVQIPCWLADTNQKMPSLKWSSEHFLGFKQMHFDEVISEVENFFYTNPKQDSSVFYAGADALCTYLLVPATMRFFKESGLAGKVDQKIIYPLMHYEHEKLWIDEEKINRIKNELDETIDRLEREIYEELGYQINLNSPVQVSQAFQRLGVETGEKTASGFMSTSMDSLEKLSDDVKKKYPALDKYVEYKTLFKLRSSYVSVLQKEAKRRGYLRCNYKTTQVPTGRLASGKDAKNQFFSPLNIQSLPKPHVLMHEVYDLHDRSLFSRQENIILGYQFVPVQKDADGNTIPPVSTDERTFIGLAEGMRPKLNVRDCIIAKLHEDDKENDFVYMACDYCIDPSTLVTLEDGTTTTLQDVGYRLNTLHEDVKVKTPNGYKRVLDYHTTGKKQKCVLTLKSGKTVTCSPDHKFYVKDKSGNDVWKALKDIDPHTDYIYEDMV